MRIQACAAMLLILVSAPGSWAAAPGTQKAKGVQVKLSVLEGDDLATLYFNPKEITIDKVAPWQRHRSSREDSPSLEFTAAEPKTLQFELMFDMFEERGNVHTEVIHSLEQLARVDKSLKRPPLLLFEWGRNVPVFKGVIENLNVKYTMFLEDGTPTRATVNLTMKQADRLMNREEPPSCDSNADCGQGFYCSDGTCKEIPAGQ
jgi:hypothetical protein